LCRALGIDRSANGEDLCGGEPRRRLWIEAPPGAAPVRIARGPRIGVDYARHWARRHWRFFDRDSAYVSTLSAAARRRAAQPATPQIQV